MLSSVPEMCKLTYRAPVFLVDFILLSQSSQAPPFLLTAEEKLEKGP